MSKRSIEAREGFVRTLKGIAGTGNLPYVETIGDLAEHVATFMDETGDVSEIPWIDLTDAADAALYEMGVREGIRLPCPLPNFYKVVALAASKLK